MTSAYILVLAILILGGLIAALGDRIGTKVGKARLRLFNLRPKQTAIVFTIVTGILISGSTLIILFTFSASLRQGIFELDEILRKRREITAELETVRGEKETIEGELLTAKKRQNDVTIQLTLKEKELINSQTRVKRIEQQTVNLIKEVDRIIEEKNKLLREKEELDRQSEELRKSIMERDQELEQRDQQLQGKQAQIEKQEQILLEQQSSLMELQKRQSSLEEEIKSRDKQIKELDGLISGIDKILKEKEGELRFLERELGFYRREVEILEQYFQTYQDLRERPIAVVKGQVLTVTLVETKQETDLTELIDGILNEANRGVMLTLGYGDRSIDQRFVQISKAQVEQMRQQLAKPGQYLVRILSAGNYVQGEDRIRIFADVTPNQIIYRENQAIASITVDKEDLTGGELQEKLDFLISVSQFKARREGVLGRIVLGDGKITSLINFLQSLQSFEQDIDQIVAIATSDTLTSGPLQIGLVVLSNGVEIYRF